MSHSNTFVAAMLLAACFVAVCGAKTAHAQAPTAANPNPELVGQLTQQLNITPEQATGGAGAIFGLAKSRMSPANFNKIATAVPGINGFLKAAPEPVSGEVAPATAGASGLGSLGPLGSAIPGEAGGVASLATSFQSLKLSPEMVGKFVPVIQNYIGSKGGSKTAALFSGALK